MGPCQFRQLRVVGPDALLADGGSPVVGSLTVTIDGPLEIIDFVVD